MKVIVTHKSPDMDGISSIWMIKKYFQGWENAILEFVPAGEKLAGKYENLGEVIEIVDGNDVIHVDTGVGKLDHHQTSDRNISAASLTLDFLISQNIFEGHGTKKEALKRIVGIVVQDDHFQEVFYPDPLSFLYDFSVFGIIDGLRLQFPHEDQKYVNFGIACLDALLHEFENRIWAENEIKEKGIEFKTKWGKGLGVETMNDDILELGQKIGYVVVIRKDPNTGFVRIKSKPESSEKMKKKTNVKDLNVDLTPMYEKMKILDPDATWFFHISKKMLLNGSYRNPKMKSTKLSLQDIIKVFKETE